MAPLLHVRVYLRLARRRFRFPVAHSSQCESRQVPHYRRCHARRLQLPSRLRVRLPVDRKVHPAEQPLRHGVLGHVGAGTEANDEGYLAFEE